MEIEEGEVILAKAAKLTASEVVFPVPSVGATQNAILAAVLAEGRTGLHNVAREPEVVHLCHFLNAAGAKISGIGTAHLLVEGVKQLSPVDYTVPSDRIVAGTYMAAVLSSGGKVFLRGADDAELLAVIKPLRAAGAEFGIYADGILVKKGRRLATISGHSPTRGSRRICNRSLSRLPHLQTVCALLRKQYLKLALK